MAPTSSGERQFRVNVAFASPAPKPKPELVGIKAKVDTQAMWVLKHDYLSRLHSLRRYLIEHIRFIGNDAATVNQVYAI